MSSAPFVFVVGLHAKRFYIHSSAVERLSVPLHALVNCGMKESVELCAVWDDIDEQTFLAFAEFVYTGDYSAPEPDELSYEEHSDKISKMDDESAELGFSELPKSCHLPLPPSILLTQFKFSKKYCYPGKDESAPERNDPWYHDFTPTFLAHAKVFELADRYDIESLAQLSLHKLHRVLCGFILSKGGSDVIWSFLRHCYETPRPQRLRDLAAFYAAANIHPLWKDEDIRMLAKDCPELAADILELLMGI